MATTVWNVCVIPGIYCKTLKPETVHVPSCLESPSKQHSLRK